MYLSNFVNPDKYRIYRTHLQNYRILHDRQKYMIYGIASSGVKSDHRTEMNFQYRRDSNSEVQNHFNDKQAS